MKERRGNDSHAQEVPSIGIDGSSMSSQESRNQNLPPHQTRDYVPTSEPRGSFDLTGVPAADFPQEILQDVFQVNEPELSHEEARAASEGNPNFP